MGRQCKTNSPQLNSGRRYNLDRYIYELLAAIRVSNYFLVKFIGYNQNTAIRFTVLTHFIGKNISEFSYFQSSRRCSYRRKGRYQEDAAALHYANVR